MVLHGIVLHSIIFYGIAWYFIVLHIMQSAVQSQYFCFKWVQSPEIHPSFMTHCDHVSLRDKILDES